MVKTAAETLAMLQMLMGGALGKNRCPSGFELQKVQIMVLKSLEDGKPPHPVQMKTLLK